MNGVAQGTRDERTHNEQSQTNMTSNMDNETTTTWREYNIHSQGNDDDGDDDEPSFDLFAPSEPVLETFEFPLPDSTTLSLQGHGEYRQSTGLTVWKGSEVLADYLLQSSGGLLCKDKRVVELGAGLGLCGLVALRGCGASHVVLTDGDTAVLPQLRHNVAHNVPAATNNTNTAHCCQLIWGHKGQIQALKTAHGMADVILASDCLYMAQSVEPFFQTVHSLLEPVSGVLLYCNPCASQAPVQLIESMARRYGLELVVVEEDNDDTALSSTKNDDKPAKLDGDAIYCFRKRLDS